MKDNSNLCSPLTGVSADCGPATGKLKSIEIRPGSIMQNADLPKISGGCNLQPKQPAPPSELSEQDQRSDDEKLAASMGITVKRLHAAQAYAKSLVDQAKARGEKIKRSTVNSKTCKKFNIKLIK